MSTQDARAFQARGEKLHDDKKISDEDLRSVLSDINGKLPGSPERYTAEGSKLKLVFSIGHLLEVKDYTREQERLIAQTLPPYAEPSMTSDPAQRKILDGIYALIKKLAQRFRDPEAKAQLRRGLE